MPLLYVPAAHIEQENAVNDATLLYVPVLHCLHVRTGLVAIVYVPALHGVHVLCPSPVLVVPDGHVGHTEANPVPSLYDPIAHFTQFTLTLLTPVG